MQLAVTEQNYAAGYKCFKAKLASRAKRVGLYSPQILKEPI